MDDHKVILSNHRINQSIESLEIAEYCLTKGHYRDSINRSYYAVFYAVKSVLALEAVDFKRHKDVVAYFNKTYVAAEIFPRELGRKLAMLKQLREKSDYDDFYLASKEEAKEQIDTAEMIICEIKSFLKEKGLIYNEETHAFDIDK